MVAPASIRTAPNSPIDLAHVIAVPAASPGRASGSVTCKNALPSVQPRVFATFSYRGLIAANELFKIRIM